MSVAFTALRVAKGCGESPLDTHGSTVIYLGEAIALDVILSNVGNTLVVLSSIKIELLPSKGVTQLVGDWVPPAPPQLAGASVPAPAGAASGVFDAVLPPGGQHVVPVRFDVRDLGLCTLSCSAVFKGSTGQPQFECSYYKLQAFTPVSVRTKVRAALNRPRQLGSFTNGNVIDSFPGSDILSNVDVRSSLNGSSNGCFGSSRSFLEVSIENVMKEDSLLLHSVKFLPLPGVSAEDPVAALKHSARHPCQQLNHDHYHEQQQQQQQCGNCGDTTPGHDTDSRDQVVPAGGSTGGHEKAPGHYDGADAPGGRLSLERAPSLSAFALLQPGGNRHFLWSLARGEPPASAASAPAPSGDAAPGQQQQQQGLGRLEICWKSADGRSGRLQTQPIIGSVQSHAAPGGMSLELEELPSAVGVDQAFDLVLRVAAAAGSAATAASSKARRGPLLLLHSDLAHQQRERERRASASSAGSSAAGQAAQPTDGGSGGGGGGATGGGGGSVAGGGGGGGGVPGGPGPGVVVLGPRVAHLGEVAPGSSRCVTVRLLPLQRGWQRLPAFVVVGRDGSPCASLHDVSVLVL